MRIFIRILALWLTLGMLTLSVPVLSSGFPLSGSDERITQALDYLENIQKPDGSIGTYTDTAWAVIAISASGLDVSRFGQASAANYLKENDRELLDSFNFPADLARNILAIIAAGHDPYSFGKGNEVVPSGNYVTALVNTHDGTQFGVSDSINEDCWAIMALVAAGYSPKDEIIQNTAAYIKFNQGSDQGWSWATPVNEWYSESDIDNTAATIMALLTAGFSADDPSIEQGVEYLKDYQSLSGGFSFYGVENISSTALAISAINAAGENPANWVAEGGNPVDYVKQMQMPDGSFPYAMPLPEGYMPMTEKTTADAVVALLGSGYMIQPLDNSNYWLWALLIVPVLFLLIFVWFIKRKDVS